MQTGSGWLDRAVLVQVVGYVGAAAAVAATFVTLGRAADLTETGTLLVMLAVAIVLLFAGMTVGAAGGFAYERMQSVLWFGAIQAWSFAVQLFVTAIAELEGRGAVVLASVLVTLGAGALWWFQRRTLQQLALFGGLGGLIVSLILPEPGPFQPPDLTVTMLIVWAYGVAWGFLGLRGAVQPARTAMVLGAITAVGAPLAFTDARLAGELLSLVTAFVLLGFGERRGDRAVAGLGIVGVLVVSAVIVVEHLESTPGTIAALVGGVVLLFGALVAARMGRTTSGAPPGTVGGGPLAGVPSPPAP